MNEITRIHLAKVPYNIELGAKKQLTQYLEALKSQDHDSDMLFDIEVRMTELLTDRSVKTDGTITLEDVESIKTQLGEPAVFSENDDTPSAINPSTTKRLYRNPSTGAIGGVISGFAEYFGLSITLLRFAFILSLFVSAGTSLLLYVVLWIVMPPAKTAANILQLRGQLVTAETMRELAEKEGPIDTKRTDTAKKVAFYMLSGIFLFFGIIILVTAIVTVFGVSIMKPDDLPINQIYVLLVLGAVSAALLTSILLTLSYAAARQIFTRKMTIVIIVSSALLLIMSFALASTGAFFTNERAQLVERSITKNNYVLPENIQSIKAIDVDAENLNVNYEVSDKETGAVLRYSKLDSKPDVSAKITDGVLSLRSEPSESDQIMTPYLTIIGPALTSVDVDSSLTYKPTTQKTLQVTVSDNLIIEEGAITTLTGSVQGEAAQLYTDSATIKALDLQVKPYASLSFGDINALTLDVPQRCYGVDSVTLSVQSIKESTITVNKKVVSLEDASSECLSVASFEDIVEEEY